MMQSRQQIEYFLALGIIIIIGGTNNSLYGLEGSTNISDSLAYLLISIESNILK